jgi:hypothetical protein
VALMGLLTKIGRTEVTGNRWIPAKWGEMKIGG